MEIALNTSAPSSTTLDARLARMNQEKLTLAAGDASMDSPPFYNCFINRFTQPVKSAQSDADADMPRR
jgi:hypothetical protein